MRSSLVNHNISNLNGGVSKQAQELRFDNQVSAMDNFTVTVAQGLRRRNPTSKNTISANALLENQSTHSYDRGDGLEKYIMYINDYGLSVVDENGGGKSVSYESTLFDEWKTLGSDWANHVRFLTAGDTTWLLNTKMKVRTTNDLTPELFKRHKHFYWLKRSFDNGSGSGYTYTININNIEFTSNDSDSDVAAKELSDAINDRYSEVGNNPLEFPDYIRAVNYGSIVLVYVAEIYAPNFRTHVGTSNKWVRVYDVDNSEFIGVDVEDYETSFKIINSKYKLFCSYDNRNSFSATDIALIKPDSIQVPYYSSKNNAKNDSGRTVMSMTLFKATNSDSFNMFTHDSWGNNASYSWTNSVSKISDLPSKMEGFDEFDVGTIVVEGDDVNNFSKYYLKWEDGKIWKETVKENIKYILDSASLPFKMVRQSDGTFYVGKNRDTYSKEGFNNNWERRLKGDDDNNPMPSFVDNNITNMFFFKNRLGFTSGENVVLSRIGSYYDFFSETVLEVLDSDPIDASIDSNTVSNIRNINTTSGGLILWSDSGQFMLSGGEVLSPSTTRISQTSSYESTNDIQPVAIDNEVIFFNKNGKYLDASIYSPATLQQDRSTSASITSHVPNYIPNTIREAVTSSSNNMMFLLDKTNRDTIYVYKYFIKGNSREISAWYKWTFPSKNIKSILVLDNELIMLSGNLEMLKIDLEPQDIDEVFLDEGVTPYTSEVLLSKYNTLAANGVKNIREPFYIKNIAINKQGYIVLDIINSERNETTNVSNDLLNRNIFIGGNSDNTDIGFSTNNNNGVQIDAISIEGRIKATSKNI
ncbi:MAG: hypothetical protein ACPG9K_00900 [Poseidonibacter sp.]